MGSLPMCVACMSFTVTGCGGNCAQSCTIVASCASYATLRPRWFQLTPIQSGARSRMRVVNLQHRGNAAPRLLAPVLPEVLRFSPRGLKCRLKSPWWGLGLRQATSARAACQTDSVRGQPQGAARAIPEAAAVVDARWHACRLDRVPYAACREHPRGCTPGTPSSRHSSLKVPSLKLRSMRRL